MKIAGMPIPGSVATLAFLIASFLAGSGQASAQTAAGTGGEILFDQGSNAPVLFQMKGGTAAATRFGVNMPAGFQIAAVGDFEGKGNTDILWTQNRVGGPAIIWLTQPNGQILTFSPSKYGQVSARAWIGDFNGDGKSDILWDNGSGAPILWTMNGGTVTNATYLGVPMPQGFRIAGIGDFNGDGLADILWTNGEPGGTAVVWLTQPGGTVQPVSLAQYGRVPGNAAWIGDFDGDGKSDIVWDRGSAAPILWKMNGATVTSASFLGAMMPNGWKIESVGDFNGDGQSDLLWTTVHPNGPAVEWLTQPGGSTVQPVSLAQYGPVPGRALASATGSVFNSGLQKKAVCGLTSQNNTDYIPNPAHFPTNDVLEPLIHPGVYKSYVILADWAELEPSRGQFDFSEIDNGLANIAAYNKMYPAVPMTAKLRVIAAFRAPDWAKSLDGPPINVLKAGTIPEQIGHFWGGEYRIAWQQFQTALAQRYDSNPMVQEVSVTSCASEDGEPFGISQDAVSVAAVRAAGLTDAAFESCLATAPQDYSAWKKTALDLAFNPFQATDSGTVVLEPAISNQIMQAQRLLLGSRFVISNHELTPNLPSGSPTKQELYASIVSVGAPIEFQLEPPASMDAEVQSGIKYGATEIEIYDSLGYGGNHTGTPSFTLADVRGWASEFSCQQ